MATTDLIGVVTASSVAVATTDLIGVVTASLVAVATTDSISVVTASLVALVVYPVKLFVSISTSHRVPVVNAGKVQ